MENVLEHVIIPVNWMDECHIEAIKLCIDSYMKDDMGNFPAHSEENKRILIKGLKEHPKGIYYLAMKENIPAGCIICFENFSTFYARPFINIHDIIVLPEFRCKGIGRSLLHGVLNEAKKRNCSKITLEVREDNYTAKNLYKSEGFYESAPPMRFWVKELI